MYFVFFYVLSLFGFILRIWVLNEGGNMCKYGREGTGDEFLLKTISYMLHHPFYQTGGISKKEERKQRGNKATLA